MQQITEKEDPRLSYKFVGSENGFDMGDRQPQEYINCRKLKHPLVHYRYGFKTHSYCDICKTYTSSDCSD